MEEDEVCKVLVNGEGFIYGTTGQNIYTIIFSVYLKEGYKLSFIKHYLR